jgi:hypothetical protein
MGHAAYAQAVQTATIPLAYSPVLAALILSSGRATVPSYVHLVFNFLAVRNRGHTFFCGFYERRVITLGAQRYVALYVRTIYILCSGK